MYQPSWSYASSITQPSWRWSYQHGKSYARWLHQTPINTRKDYHASTFMIIPVKHTPIILALELLTWKEQHKIITSHTDQYTKRLSCIKHNPTILALELSTWKELRKMVTSYTNQYTKRLSWINIHDHTHHAQPNHHGVGVINMERATQDGYTTHRSKHEKIIMHQPSWSYASSITQRFWRWSYQHGKSYTRWLHHTPINTRKDYHASTFMIIRINHNPTILALELSTWKELRKMVTSHTDQYTKRLWCINLHDHTRKAEPNHLGVGVIKKERATQDGYITHRSIHEKITMHQSSWSYASSITQRFWRWSYQHGKSYARWLHHTPINTRKDYHASTFMIIRIKHNPTILALELSTWEELRKMVTSHTDQNTKNYHASTFMIIRIKHNPTIWALEISTWKELRKTVTSHTDQYTKRLSCLNLQDHTHQA